MIDKKTCEEERSLHPAQANSDISQEDSGRRHVLVQPPILPLLAGKRRHFEVQLTRLLSTKCQSICVASEHCRGRNGREEEQTVYAVVGLLKTLPGDGATSRAAIGLQTQDLEVKERKKKEMVLRFSLCELQRPIVKPQIKPLLPG